MVVEPIRDKNRYKNEDIFNGKSDRDYLLFTVVLMLDLG